MKYLKDLDHYTIGSYNYPKRPVEPKPDGTKFIPYEVDRGKTEYMPVLFDEQQEWFNYELKLYSIKKNSMGRIY